MKRIIIGTALITAVHLLAADALTCSTGIVCIHDNDDTELCAEQGDLGINCPAGSKPKESGTLLPICSSGNVPCIHNNDGTGFCYPGYICPAGSTQVGSVNLPDCPNNQQMCVYGSMYGCFDWACPSGMTPVGSFDCTIPPKTCESGEKLCIYDIGNAFACQSSGWDCWPGTHEWKPCPTLDFANNRILLKNRHYIQCMAGLKKTPKNVTCTMPLFDFTKSSWPLHYQDGKELYLRNCDNSDNSARWLLPLANDLGFSKVSGQFSASEAFQVKLTNTWIIEYNANKPPFPEYCYVNGELLYWTDPRCKLDDLQGNCFITAFTFTF